MNLKLPKIYPITDVGISGLSHAEQVEKLIAGGAEIIQLRDKYSTPLQFFVSAGEAFQIAKKSGVRIIINDRVDIALALKADGVHLGQDDLPPDKARAILGDDAIIGYSTHSVRQATAGVSLPVDYIAIGPIFQTRTKENPDDIVGLKGLREVRDAIGQIQLVAIGGINAENLQSVFEAGSCSIAMIDAIVSEPAKIEARMRQFANIAT